jgi:Flp pilus assembly protein TadG
VSVLMLQRCRQICRHDRGQSLVEFALCAVLFLLLLFGTIEFGLVIYRYNMVSNLAQEGARYASVHGTSSLSPASSAAVQTYVQSRSTIPGVTVTTTPAPSALSPGDTVTVQVQTNYTVLTGLLPQLNMTLRSTAKMVMSR